MNNEGTIILSILIPTIPEREVGFDFLFTELWKQETELKRLHPMLGQVEFLINDSKKYLLGGLSIGKKREHLAQLASGRYLCFLDDDESIAPNYLETLVRLCNEDKDVCTFRSIAKLDNFWTVVDMSLEYTENEQATPLNIVKRSPWHVSPVRTDFAKMFPFPDTNYSEDWEWFSQVLKLCQTEAKTNAIIHQYNHSNITSEADKITQHGSKKFFSE